MALFLPVLVDFLFSVPKAIHFSLFSCPGFTLPFSKMFLCLSDNCYDSSEHRLWPLQRSSLLYSHSTLLHFLYLNLICRLQKFMSAFLRCRFLQFLYTCPTSFVRLYSFVHTFVYLLLLLLFFSLRAAGLLVAPHVILLAKVVGAR